jgi:hypothetical protein
VINNIPRGRETDSSAFPEMIHVWSAALPWVRGKHRRGEVRDRIEYWESRIVCGSQDMYCAYILAILESAQAFYKLAELRAGKREQGTLAAICH